MTLEERIAELEAENARLRAEADGRAEEERMRARMMEMLATHPLMGRVAGGRSAEVTRSHGVTIGGEDGEAGKQASE